MNKINISDNHDNLNLLPYADILLREYPNNKYELGYLTSDGYFSELCQLSETEINRLAMCSPLVQQVNKMIKELETYGMYCPWCDNGIGMGHLHKANCPRQQYLAEIDKLTKGEK